MTPRSNAEQRAIELINEGLQRQLIESKLRKEQGMIVVKALSIFAIIILVMAVWAGAF